MDYGEATASSLDVASAKPNQLTSSTVLSVSGLMLGLQNIRTYGLENVHKRRASPGWPN
ncbi:hypothetical protein WOLCODRAFT_139536 [Wolfiporia cocos MD-104 SS10]|uniref:Uncharacterized protein n=1 Tax=Wolfiporia cocos (strain MD-104) TaxID=742152 RepID=A0A2H3J7J9_WOLCO|nr:hypothetical protein WOLCODRAFT_139536 [Wolfiporia cocos MD-104 SS10]